MTSQLPPQPQQQPPGPALDTAAALAAAGTVTEALTILGPLYLKIGISHAALQAALGVTMGMPPGEAGFHGPATAQAARVNHARRAAFVLSSARRMQDALGRARSMHQPSLFFDQLKAERRFYGQHLVTSWAREQAAAKIDSQSMLYGRLLGWNTVHTKGTTPECRAADRRNFYADREPPIGWPGMAHPGCRCYPGAPFPGAPLVGAPSRAPQRIYAGV